ncbi:hypothetical protein TMatcc_007771 [Talaromyces marneffei ATCC 18224]
MAPLRTRRSSCMCAPTPSNNPRWTQRVRISDTELTLDGGNQRRTLEEGSSQSLEGASELSFTTGNLVVETNDTHVLLSGTLLGLDETGCTINADNQTTGDFGVEGTTVTGFLNSTNR